MDRWLRETRKKSSPADSFRIGAMFSRSSTEDDESIDRNFFHHPHRQICYIDLPERHLIAEFAYPTCRSDEPNSPLPSLDEQIYEKLVLLQHRDAANDPPADEEEDEWPIFYYHGDEENFDFAPVALWYRNVLTSMKKFM